MTSLSNRLPLFSRHTERPSVLSSRPGFILINGSLGIRQYPFTSVRQALHAYRQESSHRLDPILLFRDDEQGAY